VLSLVVRRVVRLLVVLVGVSLVTFAILQVSGDPIALMMPEAPEADRAALRQSMGFNEPVAVQFARFVGKITRGDFGQSFFHREPALPLGVMSAIRRNSVLDHGATLAVFLGTSMPVFWTGIMLMLLFAVTWQWLPASGWDTWQAMVLPAFTLGTFQAPLFLRMSRSAMLEVLGLDYVRTARAKGLGEWGVITRHALKNAAIPIVTVIWLESL
jgi:ABC-type dipeptide/oligopeptide/nickel transport system permease component